MHHLDKIYGEGQHFTDGKHEVNMSKLANTVHSDQNIGNYLKPVEKVPRLPWEIVQIVQHHLQ